MLLKLQRVGSIELEWPVRLKQVSPGLQAWRDWAPYWPWAGGAAVPLQRLVTERSISTNTAAADGNASSMTLNL